MKIEKVIGWFDGELEPWKFDDVSNNGLQIAGPEEITKVAFAVDASAAAVKAAAECGAQLLVAHHGVSWGGGIRRITGGMYNVVKSAIAGNVAVAAYHLPLDANRKYGNNYNLARFLGLKKLKSAFSYHGNVIGVTGINPQGVKVGVCSGGAGEEIYQMHAKGYGTYLTGEENHWVSNAARDMGINILFAGHYATETFGVKALGQLLEEKFGLPTVFIDNPTGM
jgi:putative NIF3 family GTP cyclohydrolase 1 type 2